MLAHYPQRFALALVFREVRNATLRVSEKLRELGSHASDHIFSSDRSVVSPGES